MRADDRQAAGGRRGGQPHSAQRGQGRQPEIRRADDGDALAAADVWLRSYAAALPAVRRAHSDDEVRGWFRAVVIPNHETWVAVADGAVVGLLVLAEAELEQLYLDPGWRGQGLGDQFVHLAKRRRPDGLTLVTFQVNAPAQRFYERHGFTEVARTDGSANEEHEPDIRYAWRPTDR
ncbi:GNAT family N-acetyltransferase [Streptomyces zagrosensis]|uniref:Ribosomal protein S18 acetylase RimI-like enzyme n=1 Tax=Streptomyces zagrosensis TaxID=1042984 RepID=A0A7W9QBA3_9ACTN|nr:GNAT family N-acetyltransferase [Streptomyces zagrosensis]MBB5937091.1 ribosomal protein S18 acetylase RimI-like enzyme [Streptomyces zagrosensis]